MNIILVVYLFIIQFIAPPLPRGERVEGYVSQYGEQPTAATLEYRIDAGDIVDHTRYDVYLATSDCDKIGDTLWIRLGVDNKWKRGVVFDCAGDEETVTWMKENNIIGEIDYWTAERLGVVGDGGIKAAVVWDE